MGTRVVVSFAGAITFEAGLSRDVTVVGRVAECDIVIDHPAVSGRHVLFRQVGGTTYVEDLASTNGTLLNGHAVSRAVVRHLDVVEVGLHKLHVFDESLLLGEVGSLDRTVSADPERTATLAANVASPSPPRETRRHLELVLRILSGARKGGVVALGRANTMIGDEGGGAALVVKRVSGYFVARLSGDATLRLNGRTLGPGTHPIAPSDLIEVGGARFEVDHAS